MSNMKKVIILIILTILLSLLFVSGCLNENSNGVNLEEIYVNINGGGDFDNIQDAINNVNANGIIYVSEGIYSELLTINKSINLIGTGDGRTVIIQPNNSYNIFSIIKIDANNCTIKGFNILSDQDYINTNVKGINISSSNNIIFDNIILGFNTGIYLERYSNNNDISNNTIFNCSNGIYTLYSNNNNISKNNISSCATYGIYILSSDSDNIFNNIIFNNSYYGVRIKGSEDNIVFNNSIIGNKQGFLCCCGASNNIIYNNIFKQNEFWNAEDEVNNQWDNGILGNYWDDYTIKYPNAIQLNSTWDTPYLITDNNVDNYPLVDPPNI
jgi:parallel beta-helix repeat protein